MSLRTRIHQQNPPDQTGERRGIRLSKSATSTWRGSVWSEDQRNKENVKGNQAQQVGYEYLERPQTERRKLEL